MIINCKICQLDKSTEEFIKNGNYKRLSKVCKECFIKRVHEKRIDKYGSKVKKVKSRYKLALIKYLKCKPCMDCNVKCPSYMMQYDHRPNEKKSFNICFVDRRISVSTKELLDEIKKCDVICGNCHLKRTTSRFYTDSTMENYDEELKTFPFYGKSLEDIYKELDEPPSKTTLKYRKERESFGRGRPNPQIRKVERPSKEELSKLVWEKPTYIIGPELGVSDKAVEKWCKIYGISKPPRGYWAKKSAGKL